VQPTAGEVARAFRRAEASNAGHRGMQMAGALTTLFFVAYLALGAVQLFAFMEGLDSWPGLGTVLSVLAFAVAIMLPR
jgi:hypothetical protein